MLGSSCPQSWSAEQTSEEQEFEEDLEKDLEKGAGEASQTRGSCGD